MVDITKFKTENDVKAFINFWESKYNDFEIGRTPGFGGLSQGVFYQPDQDKVFQMVQNIPLNIILEQDQNSYSKVFENNTLSNQLENWIYEILAFYLIKKDEPLPSTFSVSMLLNHGIWGNLLGQSRWFGVHFTALNTEFTLDDQAKNQFEILRETYHFAKPLLKFQYEDGDLTEADLGREVRFLKDCRLGNAFPINFNHIKHTFMDSKNESEKYITAVVASLLNFMDENGSEFERKTVTQQKGNTCADHAVINGFEFGLKDKTPTFSSVTARELMELVSKNQQPEIIPSNEEKVFNFRGGQGDPIDEVTNELLLQYIDELKAHKAGEAARDSFMGWLKSFFDCNNYRNYDAYLKGKNSSNQEQAEQKPATCRPGA